MTISTIEPRVIYTANGAQNAFTYPFRIFDTADLNVYLDGVAETDVTISGAGDAAGGTVLFASTPADNVVVTLERDVVEVRETDFTAGGAIRAETVNAEFDKLWAASQENSRDLGSTMLLPKGEAVDLTLPTVATRAGNILAFDSLGQPSMASQFVQGAAVNNVMLPVLAASALNGTLASALATLGVDAGLHDFLSGAASLGSVALDGDAVAWAAAANLAAPGSVVIDPTGVEDSAAGIEAWIAAGYAAGVRIFFLPAGRYKVTSPILLRDAMALVGAGNVTTQIRAEYCGAIASHDETTVMLLAQVRNLGVYGKDGEKFLADGVTPNTGDNIGIHLYLASRGLVEGIWYQGFTNGIVLDGTENAEGVYGCIHTAVRDCNSGFVDQAHGNNNYPERNIWFRSLTLNGGPDGCGVYGGSAYTELLTELQEFDGDGAETVFTLAPVKNGTKITVQAGDVIVYVDGVLQTLTTDYAVTGIGTTTPIITFVSAPPSGTDNVEVRWSGYAGIANIDFDQANGCVAVGVSVGGAALAYRFNERGCGVFGGYIQLAGVAAFGFTANSSGNYAPIQGVGISESGVRRTVSDAGENNLYLPNSIVARAQLGADYTTVVTASFNSTADLILQAVAQADGSWVYRVEGDVELSQNGGTPLELGCEFGLQRFNPQTNAYETCHLFSRTIRNTGTTTVTKNFYFELADTSPLAKLLERNPFYRLGVKPLANTQATLKAGAIVTLAEAHYG